LRSVFTQLLVNKGIVPAEHFPQENRIVFKLLPSIEDRAKIRFLLGKQVQFVSGTEEEVECLTKLWRSKLTPQLESGSDSFDVDNEYLEDLASEAPVIRMVNHLLVDQLGKISSFSRKVQDEVGTKGETINVTRTNCFNRYLFE